MKPEQNISGIACFATKVDFQTTSLSLYNVTSAVQNVCNPQQNMLTEEKTMIHHTFDQNIKS